MIRLTILDRIHTYQTVVSHPAHTYLNQSFIPQNTSMFRSLYSLSLFFFSFFFLQQNTLLPAYSFVGVHSFRHIHNCIMNASLLKPVADLSRYIRLNHPFSLLTTAAISPYLHVEHGQLDLDQYFWQSSHYPVAFWVILRT